MSSIYAKIHKSVIVLLLFLLIRDEHVIALFVLKWYAAYLQTVLIDAVGVSVIVHTHEARLLTEQVAVYASW